MYFRVNYFLFLNAVAVVEGTVPLGTAALLHPLCQKGEHLAGVSPDAHLHGNDFPNLGGVYVYVDNLGLAGVGVYGTGYAVVKTHSHGHQHVTLVGHDIGRHVAVHPYHAPVQREVGRQGAQPQQRGTGRNVSLAEEGLQLFFRMAQHHSLAEDHERLLGVVQKGHGLVHGLVRNLGVRDVAADEAAFLEMEIRQAHLRVLGKVQHNGAGAAGTGNVEGAGHGPGHLVGGADLVVPLADGGGEADDVGLLEGVRSQGGGGNLAGDDYHRGGVRHGIGHAGNHIGGSGAGGHNDHAGLSRDAGVALGRVDGALLVAYQHVMDHIFIVAELVVHRHNLASGIPEDGFYTFCLQGAPEGFGTCYGILAVHLAV